MRDIVVAGDVHLEPDTPLDPSYKAFKNFVHYQKPDAIVLLGDVGEFACFSSHDRFKRKNLEGRRYKRTCQMVRRELSDLRESTEEMYYIMGNHEDRVVRYIEEHPELDGALDLYEDLGFEALGIHMVEYNDVLNLGRLNFTHGNSTAKYHAEKMARDFGDNIFYGHTHDHQIYTPHFRVNRHPYVSCSCGCLCSRNPGWLRGKPNRWVNGFVYVEVRPDGNFNHHWLAIIDGQFSFAGTTFVGI